MLKQRHTPIRTCVACRATDEKRDLLRVVRQPDGGVCYDPKGKISGRGAYVCATLPCIAQARKQRKLERSLKVSEIDEALFEELNARAAIAAAAEPSGLMSPFGAADQPAEPLPSERAAGPVSGKESRKVRRTEI